MPLLDVSELMTDIDFCERDLICVRQMQTVTSGGIAVNTGTPIRFTGVVTNVKGYMLERNGVGELITGSILICTRFRLQDGKLGFTADIVQRGDRSYTVAEVLPYSRYGRGFVEATCELRPLLGTTPPPGPLPVNAL